MGADVVQPQDWPCLHPPLTSCLMSWGGRYAEYGFAEDAVFKNKGLLIAWDPLAQEKRWEVEHPVTMNGGVLSTAGNIVFQGTPSGTFDAYEAKTGKKLWSYDTRSVIHGGPSTVMVGGKQIILVPSGDGTATGAARGRLGRTLETYGGAIAASSVLIGRKDGVCLRHKRWFLKPVLDRQPVELAEKGKAYYDNNCAICHGQNVITSGHGRIKDLRNIRGPRLRILQQILRDGILKPSGMPQYADITDEEIAAVQAYIMNEAWVGYMGRKDERGRVDKR